MRKRPKFIKNLIGFHLGQISCLFLMLEFILRSLTFNFRLWYLDIQILLRHPPNLRRPFFLFLLQEIPLNFQLFLFSIGTQWRLKSGSFIFFVDKKTPAISLLS